jgi:hypothetical protein
MWRALFAALPLAQIHLALRFGTTINIPNDADGPVRQFCRNFKIVADMAVVTHATTKFAANLEDIVKLSRSNQFKECCRKLDLRLGSDDVALKPATFRYAIFDTRRARTSAQRSRAARKTRLPVPCSSEFPPAHGRVDREEIDELAQPPVLVITPEMLPDVDPFWRIKEQLKAVWDFELQRHGKRRFT